MIQDLPHHRYVWIDTAFTHKTPVGFIPAVWFGLVSHPGRMWGCNVVLESGGMYRCLPPHALAFRPDPEPVWTPRDSQRWDCYGHGFQAYAYNYLQGLRVTIRANGKAYSGRYLFTVLPVGDGWSASPDQAKEFTFVELLENGRLSIQPTNDLLVIDTSFTTNPTQVWPTELRRQTEWYTCE